MENAEIAMSTSWIDMQCLAPKQLTIQLIYFAKHAGVRQYAIKIHRQITSIYTSYIMQMQFILVLNPRFYKQDHIVWKSDYTL